MGRGAHGKERAEMMRRRLRSLQHARYNETVLEAASTGVLTEKEKARILNWLRVGKSCGEEGAGCDPSPREGGDEANLDSGGQQSGGGGLASVAAAVAAGGESGGRGARQRGGGGAVWRRGMDRAAYEKDIKEKLELLVAPVAPPPASLAADRAAQEAAMREEALKKMAVKAAAGQDQPEPANAAAHAKQQPRHSEDVNGLKEG